MFASNSVALQDSNSNFVLFQPMELLGQTMLHQRLLGCRGETWGLRCVSQSLFVSWQRDFYWGTVLPVYTTTFPPLCNHRYPPCCWHGRSNESHCSVQYFRLTPHCTECCGKLVFEWEQAEEHRSALRTQGTLGAPRPHTVSMPGTVPGREQALNKYLVNEHSQFSSSGRVPKTHRERVQGAWGMGTRHYPAFLCYFYPLSYQINQPSRHLGNRALSECISLSPQRQDQALTPDQETELHCQLGSLSLLLQSG